MKEKAIAVESPSWLRDVKDVDVSSAIFALLFSWEWDDKKEVSIDNLREYLTKRFDDLNDSQVAEMADLLIEHGVVRAK